MLGQTLKITVSSLSTLLLISGSVWAQDHNSVHTRALSLAQSQQHHQALELLFGESAKEQASYEHRVLKTRILSWAGRYEPAETELRSLMAEYPNNADLHLLKGNLSYYQGNLDAAQRNYETVLALAPNYADARTGLENVRKARTATDGSGSYAWRIDGGAEISSFKRRNMDNWNEQYLRAETRVGDRAIHGRVQRYDRFGNDDYGMEVGVSDAVRGGIDWGLSAGVTASADFRPDYSLGGRAGYTFETEGGPAIYAAVSYRLDHYDVGNFHNVQPSVSAYFENGTVITGRLIGTMQTGESDQLGWLTEVRLPVSETVQVRVGYADAPEAVNGVAVSTQSIFGGVTYSVSDQLDVHANLARDDREDSYIRNGVNLGFTFRQ